jgi:molybdopterin-guanine dinucleotide biosynthesis protein A
VNTLSSYTQRVGQRLGDRYAAVVLTGGSSRRLSGVDKTGLEVAGLAIRLRVLASVSDAAELFVAGPRPQNGPELPQVRWIREDPPGGGPVAGIAAAATLVTSPVVVVLAGDLPFTYGVADVLLARLSAAVTADGVVPVDATGRLQPLAAAYRTDALRAGLNQLGDPRSKPIRDLLALMRIVNMPAGSLPEAALADVDTLDDLVAARIRAGHDFMGGSCVPLPQPPYCCAVGSPDQAAARPQERMALPA